MEKLWLITSYARDICIYIDKKEISVWWPGYFIEQYFSWKPDIIVDNLTPYNFYEVEVLIDDDCEVWTIKWWSHAPVSQITDIEQYSHILINTIKDEVLLEDFEKFQGKHIYLDVQWFRRNYPLLDIDRFQNRKFASLLVKVSDYELSFMSDKLLEFLKENHVLIITQWSKKILVYNYGKHSEYTPKPIDRKLENTLWAWDWFLSSIAYSQVAGYKLNESVIKAIEDVHKFLLQK